MNNVDVVAVYQNDFSRVFSNALNIKASINVGSKLMEHPVEDGSTRTDFRIITPIDITLGVILRAENYRQTYNQIYNVFKDGISLIVQTKAATYVNMMLQEMPHEESPDYFDTLVMTIKLKEVILVQTRYLALPAKKVKNKNKQSTKKKGQQTAAAPTPPQAAKATETLNKSVAARGIDYVRGIFN